MKRITLPDELDLDTSNTLELYYYQSSKELSKQQIILNKNTFSFLVEGSKEVFFGNASKAIEKDQFLLMNAGHCLMTEKLSSENQHYRSILFFFSNELLLQFIRKYDIPVPPNRVNGSVFAFEYDSFLKAFTSSLLDILKVSKRAKEKLLAVKFEEVMLYLIEKGHTAFIHSLLGEGDNAQQQFIKTIESNQLNKLTVKELAFLCNMSVSTFKRVFEKRYQESPIKWFQNRRLEYAYHLLKEEQKRPTDIFYEVGYENLSSFVQAYKAKYGVTPKQHHKI